MSPNPGADARNIVDNVADRGRPLEQFPQSPPSSEESLEQDGTGRFLNRLMYRSPFMDLYVRSGERTNTGRTSEARLKTHKKDHPRLFLVVFWLDLLLRVLVVGALAIFAVLILWKAIAPIPPLLERAEVSTEQATTP